MNNLILYDKYSHEFGILKEWERFYYKDLKRSCYFGEAIMEDGKFMHTDCDFIKIKKGLSKVIVVKLREMMKKK